MGIIWEAIAADTVTWEASSVLTSGSSEPTWPTEVGAFISDGTIAWETTALRITDENCPNSKVVAIAASKVFAGDRNVVRFCATLNARDWSTEEDAGFLPTGLQQKSQVGVNAMGVYRGNLAIWSGSTFQIWQVDPDPAAMALLDAMEGIGSIYQQAVQPVSDDLFFLAALGVRTVSVAAGSENLATGDIGKPIDSLIQAELTTGVEPHATYYPSAGQYWLAFRDVAIGLGLLLSEFLLTSPPYPIEAIDEVVWAAEPTGGESLGVVTEKMEFSASALNSDLDRILLKSGTNVEELEFSTTALNSELEAILLESGTNVEELQFSTTALDSTLEFALVRHTNPEEEMDWSAVPTGGTSTDV